MLKTFVSRFPFRWFSPLFPLVTWLRDLLQIPTVEHHVLQQHQRLSEAEGILTRQTEQIARLNLSISQVVLDWNQSLQQETKARLQLEQTFSKTLQETDNTAIHLVQTMGKIESLSQIQDQGLGEVMRKIEQVLQQMENFQSLQPELQDWKKQMAVFQTVVMSELKLATCPGFTDLVCGKIWKRGVESNDAIEINGNMYCMESCVQHFLTNVMKQTNPPLNQVMKDLLKWIDHHQTYPKYLECQQLLKEEKLHARELHKDWVRPYRLWLFDLMPGLSSVCEQRAKSAK